MILITNYWLSINFPQRSPHSFPLPIFIGFLFFFMLLILMSTLYILYINPLSDVLIANIFFHVFSFSLCFFCHAVTFFSWYNQVCFWLLTLPMVLYYWRYLFSPIHIAYIFLSVPYSDLISDFWSTLDCLLYDT